ncbi:pyridoxal-phosphate dependent enzyme [Chromobacterium vaccinii]|uniref:pyridoxal-phosphate dependent enzyme n=1 Tax=Chromobacterium vaccinii TaxID=1108595 RepID=UPI000E17162B|nr:pyridoxal-phosphate dependent enzyme [Chromobacterium vaccinii]SUX54989.1 Cysteine synthase [Chromobacterium vaccinii]
MTPLLSAPGLLPGLSLKLEYLNPSLSIKHRSLPKTLLERASAGRISRDATLVIMTAGSAGVSVAWAASQIGCKALLLMPDGAPDSVVNYARWLGAEVERRPHPQLQELLDAHRGMPGSHVVEQLSDPELIGHYREVGEELLRQAPGLAAVTVSAGTCASLMGIAEALAPAGVPVYAVEPAEAAVLSGEPWRPHNIPGLAPPAPTRLFRREAVAGIVPVASELAWSTAREALAACGEPVGPSSGAAIAAARMLRGRGVDGDIVAVCSSHMVTSL